MDGYGGGSGSGHDSWRRPTTYQPRQGPSGFAYID